MAPSAPEITDDQLLHEMPPPLRTVVEHMHDPERNALYNLLRTEKKGSAERQKKIEEITQRMKEMEDAAKRHAKAHAKPHVAHDAHDDHGHGGESWQPKILQPILPQSNKEAFSEGAGIAAASVGTAMASQAVFPGVANAPLYATLGAGAAAIPAMPGVGAALGYMLGNRYGKPMTGMALGGLTGAGATIGTLNALGATSVSTLPLLLPVGGTLAGYYLGKKLGHPMLGMATGTALSTYLTYASLTGGAAALGLASPLVIGAGALGAAGLAAYMSANQIKAVIKGDASWYNPFNWALSPFTGLVKGALPSHHNKIRGLEHLFAVPGKVFHSSLSGVKKIFTHEAPQGFVESVWTAPTRFLSGLYKGFSGDHAEGFVERNMAKPGRFLRWMFTPQEGGGGGH